MTGHSMTYWQYAKKAWIEANKIGRYGVFQKMWGPHELKLGTCVGTDAKGNRYYEDVNALHRRTRWVDYADYDNADSTTVPAEWHSWLHFFHDATPEKVPPIKRSFEGPHYANPTGDIERRYLPRNHWERENRAQTFADSWIPKAQPRT